MRAFSVAGLTGRPDLACPLPGAFQSGNRWKSSALHRSRCVWNRSVSFRLHSFSGGSGWDRSPAGKTLSLPIFAVSWFFAPGAVPGTFGGQGWRALRCLCLSLARTRTPFLLLLWFSGPCFCAGCPGPGTWSFRRPPARCRKSRFPPHRRFHPGRCAFRSCGSAGPWQTHPDHPDCPGPVRQVVFHRSSASSRISVWSYSTMNGTE